MAWISNFLGISFTVGDIQKSGVKWHNSLIQTALEQLNLFIDIREPIRVPDTGSDAF